MIPVELLYSVARLYHNSFDTILDLLDMTLYDISGLGVDSFTHLEHRSPISPECPDG